MIKATTAFSMTLVLIGITASLAAQSRPSPAAPPMLMPNGTAFEEWSDRTHYTRTYHVSQNNPHASDQNDGTEARPFRTINHAAQIVQAGERVLVHTGIYREMVRPRFSGEAEDRMIAYEAAPGEQVIIRGSRIFSGKWTLSADPRVPPSSVANHKIYSKQLWMTDLPDSIFEYGYFPFQIPNATDDDFKLMDWAKEWKGRIPYTLPRGLLFQAGRRMIQLATYEDILHLPGTYWVAPGGKTIHIHPFNEVNPNLELFEVTVQEHLLQPQTIGLGFIRVSGLTFEHCANGFLRTGVGAVFTMGGHHWLIERNTVRQVNSVGIEIGYMAYEYEDPRSTPRTDPNIGHTIVRGNRIYDCGTAGIRGLHVTSGLVEDNDVAYCGWQDAEFHWEVAGIKLLVNRGTLVRNNRITHMRGGAGIWLDWDAQNSRVTGNLIYDISTVQGAIFIEAAQARNLVDNNVMWNIDGEGVRLADSDDIVVAHNLFAHVSEEQIFAKVATDRDLNDRKLTSTGNQIVNNIFVDPGKPIASGDASNFADNNIYVSTLTGITAARDAGPHSLATFGRPNFNKQKLSLSWSSNSHLPNVPLVNGCDRDFFGHLRTPAHNIPGPFLNLNAQGIQNLMRENWKVPVNCDQLICSIN